MCITNHYSKTTNKKYENDIAYKVVEVKGKSLWAPFWETNLIELDHVKKQVIVEDKKNENRMIGYHSYPTAFHAFTKEKDAECWMDWLHKKNKNKKYLILKIKTMNIVAVGTKDTLFKDNKHENYWRETEIIACRKMKILGFLGVS